MESHKAKMTQEDRNELRKRALEEIRNTKGIKEEFITDILINAKENEILKREFSRSRYFELRNTLWITQTPFSLFLW